MMMSPRVGRLAVGFALYLLSVAAVCWLVFLFDRPTRVGVLVLAWLMTALFVGGYHRWTHGHWRDSRHGVHIMTFSSAVLLVLSYVLLAFAGLIPLWFLPYLSAITYLTMAWLFGWRYALMRSDQRRPKGSHDGT